MRYSIIVATVNRTEENLRLLKSIAGQQLNDLEVIVADQNADDSLVPILAQFKSLFTVVHLRTGNGLSHARNEALAFARGEIICFPDDDCWYPRNLLIEVDRLSRDNPSITGFTGRCTDEHGRQSAGRGSMRPALLDRHNVWHCGVSAAMFLRSHLFNHLGGFDEELGLGAGTPFQSGEETDLLLRAVKEGFQIQYLPSLVVFHPLPTVEGYGAATRAWSYGAGMGRVLRKQGVGPLSSYYHILLPVAGALMALLQGDRHLTRIRIARALGRLKGWLAGSGAKRRPSRQAQWRRP